MFGAIVKWWRKPLGRVGFFIRLGLFWCYAGMFIAIGLVALTTLVGDWESIKEGGVLACGSSVLLALILWAFAYLFIWVHWKETKKDGSLECLYKKYLSGKGG